MNIKEEQIMKEKILRSLEESNGSDDKMLNGFIGQLFACKILSTHTNGLLTLKKVDKIYKDSVV